MMGKKSVFQVLVVLVILLSLLVLSGCGKKQETMQTAVSNADYSRYISATSSNEMSRYEPFRIRFADAVAPDGDEALSRKVSDYNIKIEPKIAADCHWEDAATLVISPVQPLESGQSYTLSIDLRRIFENVTLVEPVFRFSVKVRELYLQLQVKEPTISRADDLRFYDVEGILTASDHVAPESVEKILKASFRGKTPQVQWHHDKGAYRHHFKITALERGAEVQNLELALDARFLGIEFRENKVVAIYPLEKFKALSAKAVSDPERYVELHFNDPLNSAQELEGLVYIENIPTQTMILKNKIRLYPKEGSAALGGKLAVHIAPGVQNIVGDRISKAVSFTVNFEELKPELKFLSNGVMMPPGQASPITFAAVNLSAVDLRIIEIPQNSALQFLQVNLFNENNEIHRVGTVLFEEKIALTGDSSLDLKSWNHFSLQLEKKAALKPGNIYRVELGMRKSYSLYDCPEPIEGDNKYPFERLQTGRYRYYDDWDYASWRDRDNPCKAGYYSRSKSKGMNLFLTNLGLIAKADGKNRYQIIVTDLQSGRGLENAKVWVYNYQMQMLDELKSDADGFARYEKTDKPAFIVAEKDGQRNYLRVLPGDTESLSSFDVGGAERQKGLSGFIYGERGVWRPGDTLHIVFILDDPQKSLPDAHPVKATLSDPQGRQLFEKSTTEHVNRFYYFAIPTDVNGLTGNHTLRIKVGGATFSKGLMVEAIMPNRLKINYDPSVTRLKHGSLNHLKFAAEWLHGAAAANLRATVDMSYFPEAVKFPQHAGYSFNFPNENYYFDKMRLFDDTLDAKGNGEISLDTRKYQKAGRLKAVFETRVFEPGGAFSSDVYSLDYFTYAYYAGIKTPKGNKKGILETDKIHPVEILTVNAEGEPVSRENLKVELFKLEWRWWWDRGDDVFYRYHSGANVKAVHSSVIKTDADGKGTYLMTVAREDWGRYLLKVTDAGGHKSGKIVYVDWPDESGRPRRGPMDGETRLLLSADKDQYQVGETAVVSFPSNGQSRALITLEKGDELLDIFWKETGKDFTTLSIPITDAMSPNIYVSVWYLQPFDQVDNDMPIRLYGIQNLNVINTENILKPVINMDAVLAPEKPYTVEISEKNGRPMTYTLAVVDEGLLNLTRFSTPEPYSFFNQKTALGIHTWDIYKYVLGRRGLTFNRLSAIGGGEYGEGMGDIPLVNRFRPVVSFLGPFTLGANEKKSHNLTMPLYTGAVRAMVVAGQDGAYGHSQAYAQVKKPLMVIATAPRTLSPGETLNLPVTVFVSDSTIEKVGIHVRTDEHFLAAEELTQRIAVKGKSDLTAYFPLQCSQQTGTGRIAVEVSSGGKRAEYNFEIELRYPAAKICQNQSVMIPADEKRSINIEPLGIPGSNEAAVEISHIPALNLDGKLRYLLEYPHGCLEQTVSAAFPQLFLSNLTALDFAETERTEGNVREAIRKISSFVTGNGDLASWPGGRYVNDWSSVYAAHFLYEARQKGYHVPDNLTTRWLNMQKDKADRYVRKNIWDEATQAYRLYVLALYEKPIIGAMNRLREGTKENFLTPWLLAAAYEKAGFSEAAGSLISGNTLHPGEYPLFSENFASSLRDQAILLLAAHEMRLKEQSFPLMSALVRELNESRHYSTQSLGFALLAMGKSVTVRSDTMRYTLQTEKKAAAEYSSRRPIQKYAVDNPESPQKITVQNKGKGDLYLSVSRCGLPRLNELKPLRQGLDLKVDYFTSAGKAADFKALKRGQDFYAEITVHNLSQAIDYKDLALSYLIPSGWELHRQLHQPDEARPEPRRNRRGAHVRQEPDTPQPAYTTPDFKDERDDRVNFYFNLQRGQRATFKLMFNAAYSGEFFLPPALVNAMYQESIVARGESFWISVTP
jgi:alpha-2-macroglobulin